MTCDDCVKAALGPWHGYTAGCKGCRARAFARSPELHALRRDRDRPGYAEALERLGLTHEQVQEAGRILKSLEQA
jgi:hypothetical protein